MVAILQRISEMGIESQIARVWFDMKYGKKRMTGNRQTPCRNMERIIAQIGRPIDWKKVVLTILMKIHQIIEFEIVRSCAARRTRSG